MHSLIIVAERTALMRDGLVALLADGRCAEPGQVRAAATLEDAQPMLAQADAALLLLDLDLIRGPDELQAIRARRPSVRIIVLAAEECGESTLRWLAAGAQGYVAKTASAAELARAVLAVGQGGVHVPASFTAPAPRTAAPFAPPSTVARLTGRQRDVLRLLAEGRSTKDIARTLDLAVSTIKVHLAAVYRAMGARNRVEALCRAGLLPRAPLLS